MRYVACLILTAALMIHASALACACDEECPEGEVYSDKAEMCVDDPDAVS